jgi:phosphatidylserine synthase
MVITLVLSVAALTSIPFPHIMRARWMRPLTLVAAVVLVGAILAGTVLYPRDEYVVRLGLYVGCGYFAVLAVARMLREARHRST